MNTCMYIVCYYYLTPAFLDVHRLLLAGLITSALMTLTDYMILFFSCHGLKIYGAWLHKHHNIDLWTFRILVKARVSLQKLSNMDGFHFHFH